MKTSTIAGLAALQTALGFLFTAPALAVPPLEVTIIDPAVRAVVLECDNGTHKAAVKDGKATFASAPNNCKINMIRRSNAVLTLAGQWTCDLDTCRLNDVYHRPIEDVPGRLNVVFTHNIEAVQAAFTCNGERYRAKLDEQVFTLDNIQGPCSMQFLGGGAGAFSPMQPGTYYCSYSAPVITCQQRNKAMIP